METIYTHSQKNKKAKPSTSPFFNSISDLYRREKIERMYQNNSAMLANSVSEAATC